MPMIRIIEGTKLCRRWRVHFSLLSTCLKPKEGINQGVALNPGPGWRVPTGL